MKKPNVYLTLLWGIFSFGLSHGVFADPPKSVIRLSQIDGTVSFAPTGIDQWVYATINRPITVGDRLWVDANSRAALQLSSAAVYLGENTSINMLNFDDKATQIELDQGMLALHVWTASSNKEFEIETPNLALVTLVPGDYQVDVDSKNHTTTVTLHSGKATVYGQGHAYQMVAPLSYRFNGKDLQHAETLTVAEPNEFNKWSAKSAT
jgi:hypothetical protein